MTDILKLLETKAPKQKAVIETAGEVAKVHIDPMILRTFPVCWGIPMDEVLYAKFFANWVRLSVMPWDNILVNEGTYLVAARNGIHNAFLSRMSCEWLVMIDSDVLPPPNFLQRLLESGKKMIGGWYRQKTGACNPAVWGDVVAQKDDVYYWETKSVPGNGIEKVGAIGAGCLLMHRSVAEQLGDSPYGKYPGGEDMVLCRLLKEKEIDLYVDWSIACAHAGVGII